MDSLDTEDIDDTDNEDFDSYADSFLWTLAILSLSMVFVPIIIFIIVLIGAILVA